MNPRQILVATVLRAVLMPRIPVASGQFFGDESCPCLSATQMAVDNPIDERDFSSFAEHVGIVSGAEYGFGCDTHDVGQRSCTSTDPGCEDAVYPPKVSCDQSWCDRNWCFVDPSNCTLLHRRSTWLRHSYRYFSYATCHDMDSYTKNNRLSSLEGRTIKVAYNSNSGGWKGAYNPIGNGQHFEGSPKQWQGPAVGFVHEAARQANFSLRATVPPDFLVNGSLEFFSQSKFDLCVYTAALGYVDLCVAQYSVTNARAMSTSWFLLSNDPLQLIVYADTTGARWSYFQDYFTTIFQPFTWTTWAFLVFFVIPIMGILMVVHEYGVQGSNYPKEEPVMVVEDDGSTHISNRPVPRIEYIPKATFISLLSTMQQSFSSSVVTVGGMLNLLGVSFFILTIIAVYTANLAAMLTQQASVSTVNNLDDAVRAGYRFCGERKVVETIMEVFDIRDRFVRDPVELGGDGLPGFNCAKCRSRMRVFDFMDPTKADTDERYCHAAIAPVEDLEVFHRDSSHCNKTAVGTAVGYSQSGLPIFEGISTELISLFLTLKNDGLYERELKAAKPTPNCPVIVEGEEGSALNIAQLTGIWIVTFGFAALGLVVTFGSPYYQTLVLHVSHFWHLCQQKIHEYRGEQDDGPGSRRTSVVKDSDASKHDAAALGDRGSFGDRGTFGAESGADDSVGGGAGAAALADSSSPKPSPGGATDKLKRKARIVMKLSTSDQWGTRSTDSSLSHISSELMRRSTSLPENHENVPSPGAPFNFQLLAARAAAANRRGSAASGSDTVNEDHASSHAADDTVATTAISSRGSSLGSTVAGGGLSPSTSGADRVFSIAALAAVRRNQDSSVHGDLESQNATTNEPDRVVSPAQKLQSFAAAAAINRSRSVNDLGRPPTVPSAPPFLPPSKGTIATAPSAADRSAPSMGALVTSAVTNWNQVNGTGSVAPTSGDMTSPAAPRATDGAIAAPIVGSIVSAAVAANEDRRSDEAGEAVASSQPDSVETGGADDTPSLIVPTAGNSNLGETNSSAPPAPAPRGTERMSILKMLQDKEEKSCNQSDVAEDEHSLAEDSWENDVP